MMHGQTDIKFKRGCK